MKGGGFYIKDASHVIGVANLKNSLQPGYLNTATVTATVADATTGLPLAGTWPVTLPYVPGSNGLYQVTLPHALAVTVGQRLLITYMAASGTVQRPWVEYVPVVRSLP